MKIAVLGCGTVGSGVVDILDEKPCLMVKSAGEEIGVKYILDIRDFDDHPEKELFTKDYNDIIADDDVKIVVEVMGGITPAYDYVKACLENGKSVVTSNKELVAAKGAELLKIAQDNNVNFLFEASVGGGIPVLRPMSQCMAANEMTEIFGILNGTTNFILTKMVKENLSFENEKK